MLPILNIGPLAIQTPGLILLLGLWLGLSLAERFARIHEVNPNHLYNLVFASLVSGAVGARLAYAIQYPGIFFENPLSLFSLNPGLLDPWGGLVGGLLAALIYGQRKSMKVMPTLDALTPALAVCSIALGLANLASGKAFGTPSDLPWAIELWGVRRHPTQIYETIAAGLVLFAIWPGRKTVQSLRHGVAFLIFLASSAFLRLFLEAFRGDSHLVLGGIRSAQLVLWLFLAAGLWGLGRLRPFSRPQDCNLSASATSNEQRTETGEK